MVLVSEDSGLLRLRPLLKTKFFVDCKVHGRPCNRYCLDCMEDALCYDCLAGHKDHHVVQIRRASKHDAIKKSEVEEFIDISSVQIYKINSAKIVFLNKRPCSQKGPVKDVCKICCHRLKPSFQFCSLGCKLRGMNTDPSSPSEQDTTANNEGTSLAAALRVSPRKTRRKGIPRRAVS